MSFHRPLLSIWLVGVVVALVGNSAACAEPDFTPERYLARGYFHTAKFSKDGKFLLTASGKIAQLWEVETGKLTQQFFGHKAAVHSVCFSPDESQVLTGAGNAGLHGEHDPTARLWDARTGKQLAVFDTSSYGQYVLSAQFSPDGKRILTVTRSHSLTGDTVELWDTATRKRQFVFTRPTMSCQDMQFSPQGDSLAAIVSHREHIRLWDAKSYEVLWQAIGERVDVNPTSRLRILSLEFSPDGTKLLAACDDQTARIWNSAGGCFHVFHGHNGPITVATFCCEGKRVLTASQDGTARLWEATKSFTDSEVKQFDHPGRVMEAAIASDGASLMTNWIKRQVDGDAILRWQATLWNVETGQPIKEFENPIVDRRPHSMVFSPDGHKILVSFENEITVLLDAKTGEVIRRFE